MRSNLLHPLVESVLALSHDILLAELRDDISIGFEDEQYGNALHSMFRGDFLNACVSEWDCNPGHLLNMHIFNCTYEKYPLNSSSFLS